MTPAELQAMAQQYGLDPAYLQALSQANNPQWNGQLDPGLQAIYGSNAVAPPTGSDVPPDGSNLGQSPFGPVTPPGGGSFNPAPPVTGGGTQSPPNPGSGLYQQPYQPLGGYNHPTSGYNNPENGLIDTFTPEGDWNMSYVPGINLGAPPTVPGSFSPDFTKNYYDSMNAVAGQIQQQYQQPLPDFNAAQHDLSNVPNAQTQQYGQSPELQQMLSGQGFNPQMMAQMRAKAIEDSSNAGRSQLSQSKIALEQAGLSGSPAGAAIQGDVARRSGVEQNQALRDIDIQSGLQGIQNQQFGIGQQSQIGLSNMQQANQMALANANRMFDAMNTNIANQQQANAAKFGATENRNLEQAGAVSGILGQQSNAFQTSKLGKQMSADEVNAANQMSQMGNQAQLDRQAALTNFGGQEQRWNTGQSILSGFAPPSLGYPSSGGGSFGGAALSGIGNSLLQGSLQNPNAFTFGRKTSQTTSGQ